VVPVPSGPSAAVDIRLDFETEEAVIRVQRRLKRPLLARRTAHDHRHENTVRILHQTLPLQGKSAGDDKPTDFDQ
jgi:hypothetical protein